MSSTDDRKVTADLMRAAHESEKGEEAEEERTRGNVQEEQEGEEEEEEEVEMNSYDDAHDDYAYDFDNFDDFDYFDNFDDDDDVEEDEHSRECKRRLVRAIVEGDLATLSDMLLEVVEVQGDVTIIDMEDPGLALDRCCLRRTGHGSVSLARHTHMLRYLLQLGCDMDLRDIAGKTALATAVQEGNEAKASFLLDFGANVDAADKSESGSILFLAASSLSLARKLIDRGINISKTDEFNSNIVYYTASVGNSELLRLLADRSLALNEVNDHGMTPLIYACANNHPVLVRDLIQCHEVDINQQSSISQSTALMAAIASDNISLVSYLVENGADMFVKDHKGRSALDKSAGYPQIRQFLTSRIEEFHPNR